MIDLQQTAPVAIVTALILIEYFVFSLLVGKARVMTKTDAPAIAGDPVFERYFRVQQNSMERLIVVIPAMWLFALYLNAQIAAALGLVFVVARILYFRGYVADPAKRGTGFGIGMLAELLLLLGALGAATLALIR